MVVVVVVVVVVLTSGRTLEKESCAESSHLHIFRRHGTTSISVKVGRGDMRVLERALFVHPLQKRSNFGRNICRVALYCCIVNYNIKSNAMENRCGSTFSVHSAPEW